MRRAKTLLVSLAAGALALSLLTSCSGMEYPDVYPGGSSSGNWTGGTSNGTTSNGNGSNENGSNGTGNNVLKDPNQNLEAYRQEVARLINIERAKLGYDPLGIDNVELTAEAQNRARELPSNCTWKYCYEHVYAGTSIMTPQDLVNRILDAGSMYYCSESYTKIGIGFYYNPNSEYQYYWDILLATEYYPESSLSTREAYQKQVLDYLNQYREGLDLPRLTMDDTLKKTAQENAEMYLGGDTPNSGYSFAGCNLRPSEAATYLEERARRYLDDARYTRIGIGFSHIETNGITNYWNVIFQKGEESNGSGSSGGTGGDEENSVSMDRVSPKTEEYRKDILRRVNVARQNEGLDPVTMTDTNLISAAQRRANELVLRYDPNHLRPDGRKCFTVLSEYNVKYMYAGENIAEGQNGPINVMYDWLNSPGHRANILNPDFHKIGIGVYYDVDSGKYYWVQIFTD